MFDQKDTLIIDFPQQESLVKLWITKQVEVFESQSASSDRAFLNKQNTVNK